MEAWKWLAHLWNVSSFDHRVKVAGVAVTALSIVVGAWLASYQIRKGQEKDALFKVHEQRKEQYDALLRLLLKIIAQSSVEVSVAQGAPPVTAAPVPRGQANTADTDAGETSGDASAIAPFSREEWLENQLRMTLYASSDVLRAHANLLAAALRHGTGGDEVEGMIVFAYTFGRLLAQMRHEVGLDSARMPLRPLLGTFINDISESRFDVVFRTSPSIWTVSFVLVGSLALGGLTALLSHQPALVGLAICGALAGVCLYARSKLANQIGWRLFWYRLKRQTDTQQGRNRGG